jgi:hypothetical protein
MFGSTGSGVAQPVSQPAVEVHCAGEMPPPPGETLGPRIEPSSCICP